MKTSMKVIGSLLAGLMLTPSVQAGDLKLGKPNYGGSGCPGGTASVTLSPDKKTLSILFDEYIVEAGDNGKSLDRKSCNIAIPVHVPNGYSLSIFQVDYRGYAYVPRMGQARFSAEYFFANSRGLRMTETLRGEYDDEYLITDRLLAESLVWSACGANTNLRINSSMLVRSNRWKDPVFATVDSADIKSGLIYHFQMRRCR